MNSRFIDMTGRRIGRWSVIAFFEKGRWRCRCDCGNEQTLEGTKLRNGGPLRCFQCDGYPRKHGCEPWLLYLVWVSMRMRCTNPKDKGYQNYGGRGIFVCEEWRSDFTPFREWSLANGYQAGLSIDRVDNDGPYSPGNCRWADDRTQRFNKRNTRVVEFRGEKVFLMDLAARFNIPSETLFARIIKNKWPIEDAISLPVDRSASTARRHARRRALQGAINAA